MQSSRFHAPGRDDARFAMEPRTLAGFLIAIAAVVVIAVLSYDSLRITEQSAQSVTRTVEALAQVEGLLSTLKDAETGQRGYLLTGQEGYLEPYLNAKRTLPIEFKNLNGVMLDPAQRARLDNLQALAQEKMQEVSETVELRRAGNGDAAMALVLTGRGKNSMDRIRALGEEMAGVERRLVAERAQAWRSDAASSFWVTSVGSLVLLMLISVAAAMASRDLRERQRESWLRAGQIGLSGRMQGDLPLDRLGENILKFLTEYLDAKVGALFVAEGGLFRRVAGHAIPAGFDVATVRLGDGLAGQAAKDNAVLRVRDVPPQYLPIGSATGGSDARELLIAPASTDGRVYGVVELGFFGAAGNGPEALLERVSEPIGAAIRAAKDRNRLEELLQETQQQAQELQTREEELRVNNEELEEQGRTLRESRTQLESQQAELEQINSQLEEQTQALEDQKDSIAAANAILAAKSAELQRANDYKSEFLANMSHELRTPLNSTLILAKLLADNKEGNLSDTQVKYAQTISSAGQDLLALINDVLDLSRIEAGKIEVVPELVPLAETIEPLAKMFEPAAAQKGLEFGAMIEPGTPDPIETDPQRLGQILKNLLSNALKFTHQGKIGVRVFSPAPGTVSFAVRDTGVGIDEHQHEVIFEAFRQADGSIHRKFGGTGLGLSISRDLARLLGGSITVQSAPGSGSTFTLTLPAKHAAADAPSRPPPAAAPRPASRGRTSAAGGPAVPGESPLGASAITDDRDNLTPDRRIILVVEDDAAFALILRDLAHEMDFQTVVVHSAGDALTAAAQFQPSAILLDINLPDFSGLGALDQLKRNPRTRHIPVHVVSAGDYRREALELGAAGYALKPTKREELVEALKRLEVKLAQSVRRVLIVEDDPRQRESIRQLLSSGDVQVSDVETATEALRALSTTTFDCVVLDFNLPDATGYDLLEQMAQQEEVSFPPVIVYTGRALSRDEEQRLGRYSRSIIIKDARSPERLLDEVTLFLHQVESKLPPMHQQMLRAARNRDASLEGRRILVVEDDVRNVFALTSLFEPNGASVDIARNGREALDALSRSTQSGSGGIDMVLMDIMMPEMDGLTAMREIRKRPEWKKLPIIALTAKAMRDDQERCLAAGANDYIAKPLDVEKLLSLVRVWMPK
ncbi:MAG TPA: response regulator [Steroidobacteraceae bacterium]|nr:response regulator [Steroidobacteraceae bacterium]